MSTNGKTLKFRAAKLKGFTVLHETTESNKNTRTNRLPIAFQSME